MNDMDELGDMGLYIGFDLDISNKLKNQPASIIVLIIIVNTAHMIVIRSKTAFELLSYICSCFSIVMFFLSALGTSWSNSLGNRVTEGNRFLVMLSYLIIAPSGYVFI